ncbi:TRAP transporter substrate-binding protein (plasmid) [Haloferacaceae archaeon DSL9]
MFGLAGCASDGGGNGGGNDSGNGGGGGSDVSMTIASTFEPGHILVEMAESFGERMQSETDGAVSVDVVPGGSYGSEDEIGELVSQRGVEAHTAGTFPYFQYAPDYYFFANPFVMDNYDQMVRLMDSDLMQPAFDQIRETGNQIVMGQQVYRGFRHFTSNSAIRTPEDVQGLNLRLPELDTWVSIWDDIGVNPTPVALDELYSALETGTVDASEGPAEQISSFNLGEVQSHYSLTSHLIESGNLYMNVDFYEELDETYQELADEAAMEITQEASQTVQDREEELINQLADGGMEIVDDVDVDAFRAAGESAVERQFEENWEHSWDDVRNV